MNPTNGFHPFPPAGPPETLVLPGGRTLSWFRMGDPHGRPVFYCHGFPASHEEARLAADEAARNGIRLIVPDRPGYGASDPVTSEGLSDWTDDMAHLADTLGVARFGVMGVSGGAPYALALAARLPERVERVTLVVGLGPIDGDERCIEGMGRSARALLDLAEHRPAFAAGIVRKVLAPVINAWPGMALWMLTSNAGPADRAVLKDANVREVLLASGREAFRQRGLGPAQDLVRFTRAWDFDPRSIQAPVTLWHGTDDRTVPSHHARELAALLPDAQLHLLRGEGHFSLPLRYMREILADL